MPDTNLDPESQRPPVIPEGLSGAERILVEQGRHKEAQEIRAAKEAEGQGREVKEPASQLYQEIWHGNSSLFDSREGQLLPDPEAEPMLNQFAEITMRWVASGNMYDEKGLLSDAFMDELKEAGLFAILIDPRYGGKGYSFDTLLQALYSVAKHGGFHASAITSASTVIGPRGPVQRHGTDEQKERILTAIAQGQNGFFSLTQRNAGVNVFGMGSYAEKRGDHYYVFADVDPGGDPAQDNRKWYATGANYGEKGVIVVKEKGTGKRLMLYVELPESETAECEIVEYPLTAFQEIGNRGIAMRGFKVHERNLVPVDGFKALFENLNHGRTALGAMYLGLIDNLAQQSIDWAMQRGTLGGKKLVDSQLIRKELANIIALRCGIEAITAMTAQQLRAGNDVRIEATVTKYFTTWAAAEMQNSLQQIFGGRIFQTDHPVGKFLGVLLVGRTFEGPNSVIGLRNLELLLEYHMQTRFDPLAHVLKEHGTDRVDFSSLAGWKVSLKMPFLKKGRELMAWGTQQALRMVPLLLGYDKRVAPEGTPRRLQRSGAFARKVLQSWPIRISNIMRKHGEALLDEEVRMEPEVKRIVFATTMLSAVSWARGKDQATQDAVELLGEILREEIGERRPRFYRFRDVFEKVAAHGRDGHYPFLNGIPIDPELYTA